MRAKALQIADTLQIDPPRGVADAELRVAERFLRWMADDRFTFLGYREYDLRTAGEDVVLAARPGTGMGVLADRPGRAGGRERTLSGPVRDKATEPQVLVVTKANARATVHRPAFLDYVGVKTFDEQGRVVGERRFLGLFTSVAYTDSVKRVPVVAEKVNDVLARAGFGSSGHSAKDLLSILETFPRDELLQADVESILSTAMAVLRLQERRRTRLFLRRDDYRRFMSCLVYLPRDRYTTRVGNRIEASLQEAFDGGSVESTLQVSESVLARLHVVVRARAGGGAQRRRRLPAGGRRGPGRAVVGRRPRRRRPRAARGPRGSRSREPLGRRHPQRLPRRRGRRTRHPRPGPRRRAARGRWGGCPSWTCARTPSSPARGASPATARSP